MLPQKVLNFQNHRNDILGILADILHYYECYDFNTYIQVKINKNTTKADLASV